MSTEKADQTSLRPAPDGVVVLGAVLSLCGYLLPWYREQSGYEWAYSGWAYASLSTGGGWTLLTFGWFAVALIAGVWSRTSAGAAMTALVAGVGGLLFALVVVAVGFAEFQPQGSINWIAGLPFGIGLPVMATGFGLLLAGGVRAVVRTTLADTGLAGTGLAGTGPAATERGESDGD